MKLNIKKILSRNDVKNILDAFYEMHSGEICIVNEEGQTLYGENLKDSHFKTPISANGNIYGEIHSNKDSSSFCSLMNLLIQNEMEKKSLAQETLERYKEIKLFEKISERITANLSLGEVADLIIQETSNLIQADNVSIMLFNSQMQQLEVMASSNYTGKMTKTLKPGEGIGGSVFLSGRGEIVNDLTLDPRFIKGDGSIQSMMCVPLKIDQDVFGVMNLISREKVNYAAGDLNVFSMIASQAAIAIENANHIRSLTENAASRERIESELNIAKKIQSSLLPHQNYSSGNGFPFSINASMYHAAQVGGDFYEYFLFDEEHLCFAIGDVAGKGIPAAIFMAVTKTLLKSCVNLYKTPGKILYHMNRDLCDDNTSSMFVTLFLGIFNINTGNLMYASAGHDAPIFIGGDGKVDFMENPEGGPLGVTEKFKYRTIELQMKKNDSLFLYTDGVTEAMNSDGNVYSVERFFQLIKENRTLTPDQLIKKTLISLEDFSAGTAQFDDITMLGFQFFG